MSEEGAVHVGVIVLVDGPPDEEVLCGWGGLRQVGGLKTRWIIKPPNNPPLEIACRRITLSTLPLGPPTSLPVGVASENQVNWGLWRTLT